MKIYCKNCEHNRSAYGVEHELCQPINIQLKPMNAEYYSPNHKIERISSEVFRMRELNKNNNCKYYKRKWYKFWIKEN